jgi:glyoxylase-like metal-dependent hydrolase (beta-lactamase superfamily II)
VVPISMVLCTSFRLGFGTGRRRTRSGRSGGADAHRYAAGVRLPFGIEAYAGREHNDLILWIESVRAVVAGDSLADFGTGVALNEWLRGGVTRERVLERLRPLLELPLEFVLPAHGAPTDRAALERALLTADVHPIDRVSVYSRARRL